ncbi:uncharacterized protein LODBEIA_P19410 [Lodderomyces beijingensis]|uniref:AAA+ ATPase domain-containing protein n=1 Tax=Lodderomyces beijingensis TaxID=1775926 RepID=A0ABP0ZJX0_9ASCO
MFKRKVPQVTSDELQQTYNDCCNETIKNLTSEEDNDVEEALKGWKSLHTTLLYKLDLFEKSSAKWSPEDKTILDNLKGIRDENVKHLIRVQLRLDEKNRRLKREAAGESAQMSSPIAPPVPPPRNTGKMSSGLRSSSGGSSNNRSMMKSLRPFTNGNNSSSSLSPRPIQAKLKPHSVQQASQAASVSWQRPVTARKNSDSDNSPKMVSNITSYFSDFDQDTYDTAANWEKSGSRTSSGISESSDDPNLIDIDENIYSTPQHSHSLVKSMDDLTIRMIDSPPKQQDPPPPPSTLTTNSNMPSHLEHVSKSSSDVRNTKPKSTYVYNKPKPINLQKLMQQTKKPAAAAAAASPSPAQSSKPKMNNITYNYVKAPVKKTPLRAKSTSATTTAPTTTNGSIATRRAAVKKEESESIASPTMDDLLSAYEEADVEAAAAAAADAEIGRDGSLRTEKEQDALIASIRGIDPTAAKSILNDVVVHGDEVYWDDIVGLESAKNSLKEAVVYPFLRPDLFKGLREPTRGMLLFGPPGTGKTMLARAVATESQSTFFSISSSSLTSKYLGESEKLVKALFLLAKKLAPSIVFMDEIDSLLSSRTEGEVESTRRIKNEFLVQWSELSSAAAGRETNSEDVSRVLILGATNLPWSIDEAARRRFVRRQYIPLPEDEARKSQVQKLLKYQKNTLSDEDYDRLILLTEGFSGSDMTALAKDSAMGPLRSLGDKLLSTPMDQIRPINLEDFENSLRYIRPSVSKEGLQVYEEWAGKFGSSGA